MLELRLRLKLFISLSVFWDCHQLVGQYPSPAIAMRKDTNMNMDTNMDVETSMDRETNMNRCLTDTLFYADCVTRSHSFCTKDIEQVHRFK